jgi:hypothetical protein
MNEKHVKELSNVMDRYVNGDGNVRDDLQQSSMHVLGIMHRLLEEAVGASSGMPDMLEGRVEAILEMLDEMEVQGGQITTDDFVPFLNEMSGEGPQGKFGLDKGRISSQSNEKYENKKDAGILPRTKKDYITPYGMLMAERAPETAENQDRILRFVFDMLKDSEQKISLNGGARVFAKNVFIHGKKGVHSGNKQASSQEALYMDPMTSDFVFEGAEIIRTLPKSKTDWLGPFEAGKAIGVGQHRVESVNAVLQELMAHDDKVVTINASGERSTKNATETIKIYTNAGAKEPIPYTDPDFIRANKGLLQAAVMKHHDPDFHMISAVELVRRLDISPKQLNVEAMKKVLGNMVELRGDKMVFLQGDDDRKIQLSNAVRSVSKGEFNDQIHVDERVIAGIKAVIIKDYDHVRYPQKEWVSPLKALAGLRGKVDGLTQRNVREVLRNVIRDSGDELLLPSGEVLKSAFRVFDGPKGPALTVNPDLLQELEPFVQKSVDLVRGVSNGVGRGR